MSPELQEFQSRDRTQREKKECRVILINGEELGRIQARELIKSFKEPIEPKVFDVNESKYKRRPSYPKRYLERT